MKFNPGLLKYEPELPLRKNKKFKINIDWKWIIFPSLILIILIITMRIIFSN